MKPDIVMQYCVYNDYPVFRANLAKYRDKVNKVILYPSRHHGFRDFEEFSKEQIKETWVTPVPIDYANEDWRQAETIPALEHVESEWIWFREQDFFVDDWDKFYDDMDRLMETNDIFGWMQNDNVPYVHPCCLFIKRELLDRTSKDFSAHPEITESDHFGMITKDVAGLGARLTSLQDEGYENWVNAFHMQGLTYPYQNWSQDRIFGVTNPESFFVYNYYSRKQPVELHPEYIKLSQEIEDYMIRHENMGMTNIETSKWKEFFI